MNHRFEFTLNGRLQAVEGEPTNRPLLDYLRSIGLTGSKQGCAEGDCGACTVALIDLEHRQDELLAAVTSSKQ